LSRNKKSKKLTCVMIT